MVTNMIYRQDEKGNGRRAEPNGRVEKLCKYCRFWEDETGDKYPPQRIIDRGGVDFRYGSCCGPAEDNFDCGDMKSNQIAVHCGHDGGIIMGENFGCIHFIEK